ncbi:MAG: hypothetical protein ACREC6_04055 [Hyphomicrobiaceae bacterium]
MYLLVTHLDEVGRDGLWCLDVSAIAGADDRARVQEKLKSIVSRPLAIARNPSTETIIAEPAMCRVVSDLYAHVIGLLKQPQSPKPAPPPAAVREERVRFEPVGRERSAQGESGPSVLNKILGRTDRTPSGSGSNTGGGDVSQGAGGSGGRQAGTPAGGRSDPWRSAQAQSSAAGKPSRAFEREGGNGGDRRPTEDAADPARSPAGREGEFGTRPKSDAEDAAWSDSTQRPDRSRKVSGSAASKLKTSNGANGNDEDEHRAHGFPRKKRKIATELVAGGEQSYGLHGPYEPISSKPSYRSIGP